MTQPLVIGTRSREARARLQLAVVDVLTRGDAGSVVEPRRRPEPASVAAIFR